MNESLIKLVDKINQDGKYNIEIINFTTRTIRIKNLDELAEEISEEVKRLRLGDGYHRKEVKFLGWTLEELEYDNDYKPMDIYKASRINDMCNKIGECNNCPLNGKEVTCIAYRDHHPDRAYALYKEWRDSNELL